MATFLLPVISRELRHLINNKAVVREADAARHRSVCGQYSPSYYPASLPSTQFNNLQSSLNSILIISDFCSSTIFGGYWFCQKCGKDYCLQCERYFSDSLETMGESPWYLENAARPRLLRCSNAVPVKGRLAEKTEEVKDVKPVIEDRARSISPAKEVEAERVPQESSSQSVSREKEHSNQATVSTKEAETEPTVVSEVPVEASNTETEESGAVVDNQIKDVPTSDPNGIAVDVEAAPPTLNGLDGSQDSASAPPTDEPTARSITTLDTPIKAHADSNRNTIPDTEPPVLSSSQPQPSSQTQSSVQHSRRARSSAISAATSARKSKVNFHVRPELLPVTRFHRDDLESHWNKLLELVLEEEMSQEERGRWLGLEEGDDEILRKVEGYLEKHPPGSPDVSTRPKDANGHTEGDVEMRDDALHATDQYYTTSTTSHDSSIKPVPDPAGLEPKSHPFMLVQAPELDNKLFDRLWSKGEPMVVNGIGERFKQSWTPDAFISRFGTEECRESSTLHRILHIPAMSPLSPSQHFEPMKDERKHELIGRRSGRLSNGRNQTYDRRTILRRFQRSPQKSQPEISMEAQRLAFGARLPRSLSGSIQ